MDLNALLQGTRWEFETFAEYLDALERVRPYASVLMREPPVLAEHLSDEALTAREIDVLIRGAGPVGRRPRGP